MIIADHAVIGPIALALVRRCDKIVRAATSIIRRGSITFDRRDAQATRDGYMDKLKYISDFDVAIEAAINYQFLPIVRSSAIARRFPVSIRLVRQRGGPAEAKLSFIC